MINTAERHYCEGEQHALAGRLKSARASFDLAVVTIQGADSKLRSTPRMEEYLNALLARVRNFEASGPSQKPNPTAALIQKTEPQSSAPMAVDSAVDPETDTPEKSGESSLIDDTENSLRYPLTIDPKLRDMINEDIANTRYGIPVVYNERVVQFINRFQTDKYERFAAGLERSGKYLPMIRQHFSEAGIPSEVIYMAMVESLFNPYAYSRARAKGIWQFIAPTAKLYGLRQDAYIDERCDPERSTQAAVRHTLSLYRQFGDWHLVMAAYNAGSGTIQRAIDRAGTRDFWELAARGFLPRETVDHIPAIMASILIAHHPEKYGFPSQSGDPLQLDKVALGRPVSLSVVSKLTGLSVEEIKELNPELRAGCTPPNYPDYQIKLPPGLGQTLQSKLKGIPVSAWLLKSDLRRPTERAARKKGKRRGQKTELAALPSKSRSGKRPTQMAASLPVSAKKSKPKRIIHKVKKGDNLTKIAARYHTDVDSLRDWNPRSSRKIRPGDKLSIYLRD